MEYMNRDQISIIDAKINYCRLDAAINEYECVTGKPAIILVNEDTKEKLMEDNIMLFKNLGIYDLNRGDGVIGVYRGNKIFVDNDLGFGEVEIR